jgi:molybdopterin-containing oxidoreductase family iron-sulfur binding subunit
MEEKRNSRRDFLKFGASIGIGSLLGTSVFNSIGANNLKVLSVDGKVLEVDAETWQKPSTGKNAKLGVPNRSFVMVIDLGRCKNAKKCIEKCQEGHYLPPQQEWMRVLKMQDDRKTAPYWFPKPCYHCDEPACVNVCPVEATFKRSDGTVLVDNEKCIGCKYCMVACPYSARTFNWVKPDLPEEALNAEYSPETSVPQRVGTVGKCDFCPDLARNGQLPHCVVGCPNGAIYYGDLNEDSVTNGTDTLCFSDMMRDKSGYRYQEHFGTQPRVFYLPAYNRAFPFEDDENEESEETT